MNPETANTSQFAPNIQPLSTIRQRIVRIDAFMQCARLTAHAMNSNDSCAVAAVLLHAQNELHDVLCNLELMHTEAPHEHT